MVVAGGFSGVGFIQFCVSVHPVTMKMTGHEIQIFRVIHRW
jgi:hypothetical protein